MVSNVILRMSKVTWVQNILLPITHLSKTERIQILMIIGYGDRKRKFC